MQKEHDWNIGIDIGGTFTDFILIDKKTGFTHVDKCLTTPADPSVGFFQGIDRLISRLSISFSEVSRIVHGTTLVTNSIIERKGAKVGLIVTKGFGDLIYIGREQRYDLYDIGINFPRPLVDRSMVREVKERIRHDGQVIGKLDIEDTRKKICELVECGAESIAVCFLHSYINNDHEKIVVNLIKERFPDFYVSASSEVMPVIKEYDRWSTTIANAYVQPLTDRYISNIEKGLVERDFRGEFFLMTSSGGTFTPELARRYPIHLLESGPVAGAIAASSLCKKMEINNALAFDMGGTTAKGCILKDKVLLKVYQMEAGRVHRFKMGSGLPILIPNIRLIEIGAGGGSIAHIDVRGVLKVGPESAEADPGPACYDLGGTLPTVTDADLILGYLNTEFFLGGDKKLNWNASIQAIDNNLKQLGMDVKRTAWVIYESVNEEMASAFKKHAAERGIDLRNYDLIVSGGAGPVHAARIAESLKIKRVIYPLAAGVFSAFGLLLSPRSIDFSRTFRVELEKLDEGKYLEIFSSMIREGINILKKSGISESEVSIQKKIDMRYIGQGYEIEVPIPGGYPSTLEISKLTDLFEKTYKDIYKIILEGTPIEIVNFKITVSEPEPNLDIFKFKAFDAHKRELCFNPIKSHREAYFPEYSGFTRVPVYDRYKLAPGFKGSGPAIIEERESTCIIIPNMIFEVDPFYNIVATIGDIQK